MTSQDMFLAFEKLMRKLAQIASGPVAYGTAILAIISLAPGMQLPSALAVLVGGIGVNILSDILLRIAKGEEIPNSELLKQLEAATEDLKKTITKDEFFNAYGHLLEKLQDNHTEHKAIFQKIESITKEIDLNRGAPLVQIEVNSGSPQISTGENARNIQTQVYIEKQIIQQVPGSRKTSRKDKGEVLGSSGSVDIEKKTNGGAMVRFLDSLDSARFSERTSYENVRLLNVLYAKAQLFLALAFGDTVVVSENQFFDSQGFLDAFYELYHAGQKLGSNLDLPIRVAMREGKKDMFQVIQENLNNENFILSLWDKLNKDVSRRKIWANFIGDKQRPADDNVLEEEKTLLNKLWAALEYFTPERYIVAKTIAPQFIARIKQVQELSDEDIYNLYTGKLKGMPVRKYLNEDEVAAAKGIRDVLKKIQTNVGEIDSRSKFRKGLKNIEDELDEKLKDGVLVLTDAVYNQTIGIGTKATLIQSSSFYPKVHEYTKAGFSLSTYIQDTSNNPKQIYTNWEIYSLDYFEDMEVLNNPERKFEAGAMLDAVQTNAPWGKLLEMQKNKAWLARLRRFRNTLTRLQFVQESIDMHDLTEADQNRLQKERSKLKGQLTRYWTQHATTVTKFTDNSVWIFTETAIMLRPPKAEYSFYLSYSFPKTKLGIGRNNEYIIWRTKPSYKGRFDERIDQT